MFYAIYFNDHIGVLSVSPNYTVYVPAVCTVMISIIEQIYSFYTV